MDYYRNSNGGIETESEEGISATRFDSQTNHKIVCGMKHTKHDVDSIELSDRAKKAAAFFCGGEEVKSGMNIGIGSGTTMKFLIDWLSEVVRNGQIKDVRCVPTSFQTRAWLNASGLNVFSLDELNDLDLTIDGADEVDAALNCIKGGGGCLLQEKVVQTCARRFVIIGEIDKYAETFGKVAQTIPIEVAPLSFAPLLKWIAEKHGGKCVLRMDAKKCFPVVSENGNYLLDWYFPKPVKTNFDWDVVNRSLLCIPGVAETGLFIGVTDAAYFATAEGEVHKVVAPLKKN